MYFGLNFENCNKSKKHSCTLIFLIILVHCFTEQNGLKYKIFYGFRGWKNILKKRIFTFLNFVKYISTFNHELSRLRKVLEKYTRNGWRTCLNTLKKSEKDEHLLFFELRILIAQFPFRFSKGSVRHLTVFSMFYFEFLGILVPNTTVSFHSFVEVQYDCKFPWLRSCPIRL